MFLWQVCARLSLRSVPFLFPLLCLSLRSLFLLSLYSYRCIIYHEPWGIDAGRAGRGIFRESGIWSDLPLGQAFPSYRALIWWSNSDLDICKCVNYLGALLNPIASSASTLPLRCAVTVSRARQSGHGESSTRALFFSRHFISSAV